ncbi:single-stranded DNA-binding protein [Mycoplasma seminis]|uniref:Single-stranded DNA-binding protein n=1 Tax=Mycoplasma seminis TaxID=512749 RepID=A0ABY9HA59_9MOLU|nr:single-stranded DNA-binding protein [Mycoplasma seminis]WLP85213.1 single-stranded DNA-binding protein [Mycoplasma seminis]
MLNEIKLIGRIANAPELEATQNGNEYTRISLAVDTKGKSNFIPVVLWNKSAEYVVNHLGKGDLIMMQGYLKANNFTNASGYSQKTLEVVAESVMCLEAKAVREMRKENKVQASNLAGMEANNTTQYANLSSMQADKEASARAYKRSEAMHQQEAQAQEEVKETLFNFDDAEESEDAIDEEEAVEDEVETDDDEETSSSRM